MGDPRRLVLFLSFLAVTHMTVFWGGRQYERISLATQVVTVGKHTIETVHKAWTDRYQ